MAKLAGVLQSQGVTRGDRVLIYMPMIPQVRAPYIPGTLSWQCSSTHAWC